MGLLDDNPFPATNPDAQALQKLLLENFWRADDIEPYARAAQLPLADINWETHASSIWPEVLRVAAGCQKLRALITCISQDQQHVALAAPLARFLAAASAAPAGPAPIDDPYAVVMVGPRPHIDRTQLRDHLRHMEQPGGSRVLVVSGSNGCGKTHTWFAISDLAERLGTFEARYVDVSQHAGQPAALADVMDLVAYSLLGKPAPTFDPEAQPDTVINRFVAWLTFEAATRPKPAWLVFDGFTADCASRAAQDLVTAVAMAADRRALPAVLVTVLGFAGKAGPDVLSYAFRDQPGRPQRADLARFFTGFAQLHGVQTDDAGVEVLVEELLGLGPLEELPLGDLSRHAHELALTAFGVSDG